MARLRFGYVNVSVDPLTAVEHGVLAEKSGFDVLWMPDHAVDVNGDKCEPWTILSAVAAQTKKIRLGSAVTDTQRSHPSRTAHSVACLDVISGGRAVLGIGAGEAMNITPFGLPWDTPAERVARLEEAIQVIQVLWGSSRDKLANFQGRHFHLRDAFLSQLPKKKPHPPIYVGAFSSMAGLHVAGRYGDGWYSWLNTPETFKKRSHVIMQAAQQAGRNPKKIDLCSHLMIAFPRNAEERKAAMLAAKATLLMEKTILRSLGHMIDMKVDHYQRLKITNEAVSEVMREAERIPDDLVYRTMAIGGPDEATERIEDLAKAGVKHFAVADFLAPKSVKRIMTAISKVIKQYN